jgi:cobyric acid synthase
MLRSKKTERVEGRTVGGVSFPAYEIHMGSTTRPENARPLTYVNGQAEGVQVGNCAGSYLHGALEVPEVVEEWLGFRPPADPPNEDSYDQLAKWFEQSADMLLFEDLFLKQALGSDGGMRQIRGC